MSPLWKISTEGKNIIIQKHWFFLISYPDLYKKKKTIRPVLIFTKGNAGLTQPRLSQNPKPARLNFKWKKIGTRLCRLFKQTFTFRKKEIKI